MEQREKFPPFSKETIALVSDVRTVSSHPRRSCEAFPGRRRLARRRQAVEVTNVCSIRLRSACPKDHRRHCLRRPAAMGPFPELMLTPHGPARTPRICRQPVGASSPTRGTSSARRRRPRRCAAVRAERSFSTRATRLSARAWRCTRLVPA